MIYINTIEHLGYIEAYINTQLVIPQYFHINTVEPEVCSIYKYIVLRDGTGQY